MEPAKVAIVIPAYNEANTIKKVINELRNELIDYVYDIVIVNDCSTDETSTIASELGVIVIDLKTNRGYSRAIEQGLNFAASYNYDFVITMDADGQHHPLSIKQFCRCLNESNVSLIIGVRDSYARFGEWLYGKIHNYFLGVKDPLCGLKAYSVSEYRKVGFFESYDSIGTELMVRLLKQGVASESLPVEIRSRDGKARFGNGVKVEIRLIKSLISSVLHIVKRE